MVPFTFFGSSELSIYVLEALKAKGFLPTIIVTTPDRPQGRGLILTPTPVKIWGQKNGISVISPAKLDDSFVSDLQKTSCELGIVASYGKIIPEKVLEIWSKKTLNVHPSLLPKYRGASPIQSAMLADDKSTGVTIMRMDKDMDHGPIVAVKNVYFNEWPTYEKVEESLGTSGGDLLANILPDWIEGKIQEIEQDHSKATFTKKITKEDGLIGIDDILTGAPIERSYSAFLKIQAYHSWPVAYFFAERNSKEIRVKITLASWTDNKLVIEKVTPEGRKEMSYNDFSRK